MKYYYLFLCFILTSNCFAQVKKDSTISDVDFLIDKIKYKYAGYSDKVKGNEFERIIKEVKASTSKDTFANLSKLTMYFNDIHLGLYQIYWPEKIDTNICKKNYQVLEAQSNKKYKEYWIDDLNQTIICLTKNSGNYYEGFVVETKTEAPIGLSILKFKKDRENNFIADVIDCDDWYRGFMNSTFDNNKLLLIKGYKKWLKIDYYTKGMLNTKTEFVFKPFFKVLDSCNVLLKMPSFSSRYVSFYDSLIQASKSKIISSKNLLIDLRNNRGGIIGNFFSLFPFLGKGSIISTGYSSLSSDDLINDLSIKREKYFNLKDTERVSSYDNYLKRLKISRGNFIYNKSDTFSVNEVDSFPTVKNIAIITNNTCVSAAELMLLYFKQSNKVKVFGQTTGGAVDFLDEKRFVTPFGKYNFFVPTTKREITPSMPAYDKTGILPDIPISDDEPDWIDFVKKYYEKK